jgi:hypothetical protein
MSTSFLYVYQCFKRMAGRHTHNNTHAAASACPSCPCASVRALPDRFQ